MICHIRMKSSSSDKTHQRIMLPVLHAPLGSSAGDTASLSTSPYQRQLAFFDWDFLPFFFLSIIALTARFVEFLWFPGPEEGHGAKRYEKCNRIDDTQQYNLGYYETGARGRVPGCGIRFWCGCSRSRRKIGWMLSTRPLTMSKQIRLRLENRWR